MGGLTSDLGDEVRALRAERKRALVATPAPRDGERKSPRVAGEAPGPALAEVSRVRRADSSIGSRVVKRHARKGIG